MNQERFTIEQLSDGDFRYADSVRCVTVDCPTREAAERLIAKTLAREARAASSPTQGVRDACLSRAFGLRL